MARKELRISGFGGQGIILSGYVVGKAAAIYDGKNATLIQSYGPEARGGASRAEVVIADEIIDYPYVTTPDVSVIMSQEAYTKFAEDVREDGVMLIDEELVEPDPLPKVELHGIPSTRIAEELGRKIVANMVMLGFLVGITGIVSTEAMEESIRTSVPRGTEELNLRAFRRGLEYGTSVKAAEKEG